MIEHIIATRGNPEDLVSVREWVQYLEAQLGKARQCEPLPTLAYGDRVTWIPIDPVIETVKRGRLPREPHILSSEPVSLERWSAHFSTRHVVRIEREGVEIFSCSVITL
jgi:hypothetical protein